MLINGIATEQLSAYDRGLRYGDGLFETIAVQQGRPCLLERHLERLLNGCRVLGIAPPDTAVLTRELVQVIGDRPSGTAKILITRGVGQRGYRPQGSETPSRLVSFSPGAPGTPDRAAVVRICRTRLATGSILAGLKHLNRLEQVVARMEWDDPAIDEGIMLDSAGNVIEGTQSNLFIVNNGALITPELSQAGIAGILRGLVIEVAKAQGLEVNQAPVDLQRLYSAEGVFLTNSLVGAWPVSSVESQSYSRGNLPSGLLDEVNTRAFAP